MVYVIDDDASVRTALQRLIRSAGLEAAVFGSVAEFLAGDPPVPQACIVADVRMPGPSGLDLPALLARRGWRFPVIFVTAYDTAEARRLAREAGAVGYFRKPVDDQALLDAIQWALSPEHPAIVRPNHKPDPDQTPL